MSRTYKDVKWKHRKNSYDRKHDLEAIEYEVTRPAYSSYNVFTGEFVVCGTFVTCTKVAYLPTKTTKPKRRKVVDTEWHWMATPSWWTRLTMNKPMRRKGRIWERKVLFQDLEFADPPGVSKKPHVYYF